MINCTLYHNVNGFQHINQHGYVGVVYYNLKKKNLYVYSAKHASHIWNCCEYKTHKYR